jgi:hypothetical protein
MDMFGSVSKCDRDVGDVRRSGAGGLVAGERAGSQPESFQPGSSAAPGNPRWFARPVMPGIDILE